jgi:hypothetical protein
MAVAVRPEQEAHERVKITRAHNEGRDYISVRKWYRAPDGQWYPTKLGVNLRADLFTGDSLAELTRAMNGGESGGTTG